MLKEATGIQRVVLKTGRTDLRRGIDGLKAIVLLNGMNPLEKGTLYLFCGRKNDRIGGLTYEGNGYLLPGKAMARLFKGKFLSGLKALHKAGKLCYAGEAEKYRNRYEYQELMDTCYKKNWVTDIRESFAGAESVMHYLGRYTHRIAISNSRILRMDNNTVTIRVKNYKKDGQWEELTLEGVEFVRRFLMHVPPKRFVRIRHYGLLSNHNKRKLIPLCRNLIGCREFFRRFRKDDKVRAIRILYKIDVTKCPKCGDTMSFKPDLHPRYRTSSA